MPVIHMDAKKRARQNLRRAERNQAIKTNLKTAAKKVLTAIASGDKAQAEEAYRNAAGAYDKAARNGVIHLNAASRKKARLASRMVAMASAPAAKGKGKKAPAKPAAKE
jgi:small subunit ribosomal protein S20